MNIVPGPVCITGASGLTGRNLVELLETQGISYISTYRSRPTKNGYKVNFESLPDIDSFFRTHKPSVVINCIVERQVDICEKAWDAIKKTNVDIVDRISHACASNNIYLIHISTDYIFDGHSGPYLPSAPPNPLQNYGISKLLAESRIRANMPRGGYAILRVPVLYCDNYDNLEETAVTLIGKKVLNKIAATTEDDYNIRRPVYIPDFCKFIFSFIQSRKSGIYHFYNPHTRTTKYAIAKQIAAFLDTSADHINPADNTTAADASRPYDTQLLDDQYNIQDCTFLSLAEGIQRCFQKLKHPRFNVGNPELYNCFLLFDLDGTLVDTDKLHFQAYQKALQETFGINMTIDDFTKAINTSSVEEWMRSIGLTAEQVGKIKEEKHRHFLENATVQFMPGAEAFLKFCIYANINFAVVTNTSVGIVEYLKSKLPLLNLIKNWVVRRDYDAPKPAPDCYRLAIQKFHKGEKHIVGFENTINGWKSLRTVTPCIYFITSPSTYTYNSMKKEDVYLISTFSQID